MNSLHNINLKIVPLAIIVLLSGCTATSIVSSWTNPDAPANSATFEKIMVAVLGGTEGARRTTEDHFSKLDPKIMPSYNIVTKEMIESEGKLAQELQSQGFDGLLTLRLIDKEQSQTYVPGTYATSIRGSYWGAYRGYWQSYYTPGYYQEGTKYLVETSLYSVDTKALLWTGITSSYNPSSLERTLDEIAQAVYLELQEQNLIN